MAATPPFKVYDSNGQYQASTKEIQAAACLMGLYGNGATIRYGHNITVWTQGFTGDATESYDVVAEVVSSGVRAGLRNMRIRRAEKGSKNCAKEIAR